MTLVVDWAIKPQHKQKLITKRFNSLPYSVRNNSNLKAFSAPEKEL